MFCFPEYQSLKSKQFDLQSVRALNPTVFCKDHRGMYIGANPCLLNILKLDNLNQISHFNDELLAHAETTRSSIMDNDTQVVNARQGRVFLERAEINDYYNQYLTFKAPFYQSEKQIGVVGVAFELNRISLKNLTELLPVINQSLNTDFNDVLFNDIFDVKNKICQRLDKLTFKIRGRTIKLTPRELDCLRLTLQGETAKTAAQKLGLSPRTVEFYLENLRGKTGCHDKKQLMTLFSPYVDFRLC